MSSYVGSLTRLGGLRRALDVWYTFGTTFDECEWECECFDDFDSRFLPAERNREGHWLKTCSEWDQQLTFRRVSVSVLVVAGVMVLRLVSMLALVFASSTVLQLFPQIVTFDIFRAQPPPVGFH